MVSIGAPSRAVLLFITFMIFASMIGVGLQITEGKAPEFPELQKMIYKGQDISFAKAIWIAAAVWFIILMALEFLKMALEHSPEDDPVDDFRRRFFG